MFLPFEFIKYYWVAKGRHGIHSPFVYDFVDKCLKIPIPDNFSNQRKALYTKLLNSKKIIQINDQGVGSKKLSHERKISEIFKISSSKGKYADLLYRISSYYKPNRILEFGTSLGIGTIHLQMGNPSSKITTLDACSETLNAAKINFNYFNFQIETINEKFNDYLKQLYTEKFDLIYIDGHHDGIALMNYLKQLNPFIHNETIIILDDIRWSQSMLDAWNQLIHSLDFNVSLDLFRVGILTPRKQQTKEHFVIKL